MDSNADGEEYNWAYTPAPAGYRELPPVEPLPKGPLPLRYKHHKHPFAPETYDYKNDEV